jgi:hypothetical protein
MGRQLISRFDVGRMQAGEASDKRKDEESDGFHGCFSVVVLD